MFIFLSLSTDELLILTAMSYDRYVAICNPLHYPVVMSQRLCTRLAIVCWVLGFIEMVPNLYMLCKYTCYRSNKVNHFFCDVAPLTKIICSDTFLMQMYMLISAFSFVGLIPILFTFVSYNLIISTILRIRSSIGRLKAFHTCFSHLTILLLLYLTLFCQYLPISKVNSRSKKLLSLFNTAAVPVLNPLIYSLKNKDVMSALRRNMKTIKVQFKY
ncbi:olfactory receptor 10A5-like [Discoglossus pictus]